MKTGSHLIFTAWLVIFLTSHLSSAFAQTVESDYARRAGQLAAAGVPQASALAENAEERAALEFLYAYMPWNDVCDYAPQYYVRQVQAALRAKRELPWGARIPEREWRHFVLPVRVNNENLDAFREVCYEQLRDRVKHLSMRDAVLEVNHWCHEHVTYRPSDERTSSPLASMRTATGRCGEESTYTVAALRAVGIPARQVYTPRWAHTDDNHAWVEAWVDGAWHFLGACEPEAVLDLGWFNAPASRGMLMHTKAFGAYDGPEDVISRTATYTEINVTANYADVARTTVQVLTADGKPAAGARVEFKLYNYGELYTVFNTYAREGGTADILSGLGDMLVWATDPASGAYGVAVVTAGKQDEPWQVVLSHQPNEDWTAEMRITPPRGKNNLPDVPAEAAQACQRRFQQEDSIRHAYVATFATAEQAAALAGELSLDAQRVQALTEKAKGNWQTLFTTLRKFPDARTLDVLEWLSEKDLRDFDGDVLADHLTHALRTDAGPWSRYIQGARIANEMLTPWRSFFAAQFSKAEAATYRANPDALAAAIAQRVRVDATYNPLNYTLSPVRAFQTGICTERNRGILFVAAARSLGIAARRDPVTGKVQWATEQREVRTDRAEEGWLWHDVFTAEPSADAAKAGATAVSSLKLTYQPRLYMENPRYYAHFSLASLNGGSPRLMEYPEDDTWASRWSDGEPLDAGDYLLTSGTRLSDGTVLCRLAVFHVDGQCTQPLIMRQDDAGAPVIGNFNAEILYQDVADDSTRSLLSRTGRGYYIVGLLRANHEPSTHILHDLEACRSTLEAWGRPIVLLFPTQSEYDAFLARRSEYPNLPATVTFGIDAQGAVLSGMTEFREEAADLPAMLVCDTFNRVFFLSHGYTIGMGEQLMSILSKIE